MERRGLLCFVAALVLAFTSAQAAFATTQTTLSLTSFADMVVDDANGHVFVTGGSGNSSIVVLDFSGQVVTTISGEAGAAGMALGNRYRVKVVFGGDAEHLGSTSTWAYLKITN